MTCSLRTALSVILITVSLGGCGDTGQGRVSFPLAAAGTPAAELRVGDWTVTVEEARVSFGPLYLCASQTAGLENCALAAAEHLGASSVDALSASPTPMGTMEATSGVTVLSGMWDHGRSWRLGETAPRPLAGAVDGERSLVMLIRAEDEARGIARLYRVALDVDGGSQPSGTLAVRSRLPAHLITEAEPGLVVRFDPSLWASMIDYDALATLPEPGTAGTPIDVPPGHSARDALVAAVTATGLPSFEWSPPE